MNWNDYSEYFNPEEFDSKTADGANIPNSGKRGMDEGFMNMYFDARRLAGVPFRITSAFRTKEHNDRVTTSSDSPHKYGLAADTSCDNSTYRFLMLKAFIEVGFNRIGIGANFIHVDCMERGKNVEIAWLY